MTKKQIVILWGLTAAILIIFALAGYIISRSSEKGLPQTAKSSGQTYRLPAIPQSARNLYPLADQAARSWQKDARLVSASASWLFVEIDHLSQPTNWTFQFFSPRTQKMYVVSVSDQQVTTIRDSLSPYTLPSASVERWSLDSHQALAAWLNHGGGDFLKQHPIVDVNAMLRPGDGESLEWVVIGAVRDSQTMYQLRIDARSGAVLQ